MAVTSRIWYSRFMTACSPTLELIQWIDQYFSTSFVLTSDHLQFMQSTFGTQNLSEVLEQTMDCEFESLLALICYPDQHVFIIFEERWGHTRFSNKDIEQILDHFFNNPMVICIEPSSSHNGATVTLELPSHILDAFVHQLKIDRSIPSPLVGCLSTLVSPLQQAEFRSIIRHAPLVRHHNQVALVQRFVENMAPQSDTHTLLFREMVALLAELAPNQDGESFFMSKKAYYRHLLNRADDFEQRRRDQAMEILMSQGVRASFGSVIHWQRRLALIDRLFHHLYGRLPVVEGPENYCFEPDNTGNGDGQVGNS